MNVNPKFDIGGSNSNCTCFTMELHNSEIGLESTDRLSPGWKWFGVAKSVGVRGTESDQNQFMTFHFLPGYHLSVSRGRGGSGQIIYGCVDIDWSIKSFFMFRSV